MTRPHRPALKMLPCLSATVPLFNLVFDSQKPSKPRVLVIGYGWAGKSFVDNLDHAKYNVKVISTTTRRLNQPKMIHSLRPEWTAANLPIVEDGLQRLDSLTNTVFCNRSRCEYDYLVLALGGETNTYGIPGVAEHAYKFKTPEDVMALKAALPAVSKVNIIGSGPTGIELACRLQDEGKFVSVTEATATILPGFSEQIRQKVTSILASRNIELRLNTKITKVHPEPDTITVWVAGIRQAPPIRTLTGNKPLTTDDQLRYFTNIYAIGDCVTGRGPPTAQNARQQGEFLARHFNSGLRSGNVYEYQEYGRILDLNDHLLIEYRGFLIQVPAWCRHILYLILG